MISKDLENKILQKVETNRSSIALYFDKLALHIFGYYPNIEFIDKTEISYGKVLGYDLRVCDKYLPKDNFICVCLELLLENSNIEFYFYAPSIKSIKFKWFS